MAAILKQRTTNNIEIQKKMKNIFILFAIIFAGTVAAQTHEITKHDGTKMGVNYIKTENNLIFYSTTLSSEQNKISKFAVARLKEKSKKEVKDVSEKIKIAGKVDYNKVVILSPSQTDGLQEFGIIESFLGQTKGDTNQAFLDQAEKRLKINAATKGAQFIVIVSAKPNELKAITYTY
jgi:SHS2 domain-containing protein